MPKYTIRKFGENPNIAIAGTPADVWDAGGVYTFPLAAAATTIVSDDTNDDDGGTGANTVTVIGQIAGNVETEETVTMNGTDAVTLTNSFLRVYRAFVATVGSNNTNVGNIQVKHGATVLAQISADEGQTLMAVYTIPDIANAFDQGTLKNWWCQASAQTTTVAVVALQIRKPGEAWLAKDKASVAQGGSFSNEINEIYPSGTDIRIRVLNVTANSTAITGGFYIEIV